MITLPPGLSQGLAESSPRYFKRALLGARQWNGSAYEYGAETDITPWLVEITPVKWKLDSESYGVWNYSNCTLTLRNERGQFKEGNPDGFFGPGKTVKNSRIRILAGTLREDGSEDWAYVFTGFVSAGAAYDPDGRTASFTLYDHMAAFGEASAEELSTLVENQLLGSDSGTEFSTTTDKVGLVLDVRRGALAHGPQNAGALNPALDYSVSGLNQIGPGAAITLSQPLTAGEGVWASWRWWHENKEIHWIADKLCDLAGVQGRSIAPVIFSGDVENAAVYDTQGQWKLGSSEKTDLDSYPGAASIAKISLIEKTFASWGGASLGLNWSVYPHGTGYTVYYGQSQSGEVCACAQSDAAEGTWDFELAGDYYVCPFFYFLASSGDYTAAQGYCFGRSRDDGRWKLWRMNGASGVVLWDSGLGSPGSSDRLRARIARTAGGEFYAAIYNPYDGTLYAGGMSVPAAQDAAYSAAGYMLTRYSLANGGGLERSGHIKNIKYTAGKATGGGPYELSCSWLSPEIDGTAGFKNWGMLAYSQNLPENCSASFQTRQRATESDEWSPWSPVLPTGQIHADRRYLQVRWTAASDSGQTLSPLLYSLRVPYATSNTAITLVNMSGLSAKEALDQLSRLCCYEMGFDAQDNFIFRPRTTQVSPVRRLDKTRIEKLSTLSDGSDRVFNRVVVSFGQYRAVADPDSQGEPAPNSRHRYGVRELGISSSAFLPSENANLAKALAPTVYSYTSRAKRRATVDAKFDLRLELGDRVTVDYPQEDLFRLWRWGDPDAAFEGAGLQYYSDATVPGGMLLAGADMRVEGIELNLETWRTRYDLVEVL